MGNTEEALIIANLGENRLSVSKRAESYWVDGDADARWAWRWPDGYQRAPLSHLASLPVRAPVEKLVA
jgi:hypothetical protein